MSSEKDHLSAPHDSSVPVLRGYMYVAKRPCGRVSALSWDDPKYAKDTAKFVAQQIRNGLAIERLARYEGDPIPEMICKECRGKPCQYLTATGAAK